MSDDNVIMANHHFQLKRILDAQERGDYDDELYEEGEDTLVWMCETCGSIDFNFELERGLVCAVCGTAQGGYDGE